MANSLGSRYVLQEALGRGAMGQVFAGSIRPSGERVAIKVLRPELVSDPEVVGRFVQERTILMSIADPNVVHVIDLVVEGDTLAIVMELVQGSDLRRQLRARGTVPPAEALHLTGQLLRGVAAVHAAGIVHRDIKPENVLVDTSSGPPRLKLTDFGVARLSYGASLTRLSGVIGTPEYMAPELAEQTRATPAADVYSAGIVLYEMLCGRTPFAGGHPVAVLRRQVDQAPPVIPGVPPELWDRIVWMLAKDPGSRPSSAAEAHAALAPLESSLASRPALAPWTGPESWTPLQTMPTPSQAVPQDQDGPPSGATVLRHRDRSGPAPGPGAEEGLLARTQRPMTSRSRRARQARTALLAVALVAVLGLVTTVAMAATHRTASPPSAAHGRTSAPEVTVSSATTSASVPPTGDRSTAISGSAVSAGGASASTLAPGRVSRSTGSRANTGSGARVPAARSSSSAPAPSPAPASTSAPAPAPATSSAPAPATTSAPAPAPSSAPNYYVYYVYHTCANGACGLNLRSGPGYSNYSITRTLVDGDAVDIVCQTTGQSVSGKDGSSSDVWDKTVQGDYAADFYINTPGTTGSFSPPIPRC